MIHKVEYIKDVFGSNFLGIKFSIDEVIPFLDLLYEYLDNSENYKLYTENQKKRDNNSYHLTIVSVPELEQSIKKFGYEIFNKKTEAISEYEISDLKMKGIGKAESNENAVYFIICGSDELNIIRAAFDLPEKDLHITLGFNPRDVFKQPKNKILEIPSKFTKILNKKLKENGGSYNFIYDISNFDKPLQGKGIDVLNITDSYLKIRVGNTDMAIGVDDENQFRVFTQNNI